MYVIGGEHKRALVIPHWCAAFKLALLVQPSSAAAENVLITPELRYNTIVESYPSFDWNIWEYLGIIGKILGNNRSIVWEILNRIIRKKKGINETGLLPNDPRIWSQVSGGGV